jgi:hypothetical protein
MTGLAFNPLGLCFGDLLQQARRVELELGGCAELRHDVVVVGVEPLGHLAGGDAGAAAARVGLGSLCRAAARHAKVVVQGVALEAAHPRGQVAQREAHVQHLVVEREVADGHQVEAGLVVPMALAQPGAEILQGIARGLAPPVGLQREFQLPLGADAGEAEVVNRGHVPLLEVK